MPDHLDEIPTNLAFLGGLALLLLLGVYLLLQRIFMSAQLRRSSISAYVKEVRPEDDCWEWEEHSVDTMAEPVSSRSAVRRSAAGSPPPHPDRSNSRSRVEYFDMDIYGSEDTPPAPTDSTAYTSPYRRLAISARHLGHRAIAGLSLVPARFAFLAQRAARICWAASGRLRAGARRTFVDNPTHGDFTEPAAPMGFRRYSDATFVASPGRRSGLAARLGMAASCLAVALLYTPGGRQPAEVELAFSDPLDQARAAVSGSVGSLTTAAIHASGSASGDDRTAVEARGPDPAAARPQVEAARAQAAAARELAERERKAANAERARSAALREALLGLRKQVAAEGRADDAREERLRNELAARRGLDLIRGVAGDAGRRLREFTAYVILERPAEILRRQRVARQARDLSRARARAERLGAEAAEASASLAEARGALDEERRRSARLRGELAETKRANAALAEAAEQERTGAVAAKERAEQAASETERTVAAERAAAAAARAELEKARLERDAVKAAAGEVASRLEEALDAQREVTTALARDLVAAREHNDRLRTGRSASPQPVPRPRPRPATADNGRVKAVSQRTERKQTRNLMRVSRLRTITLPYSLRPTRPAVE